MYNLQVSISCLLDGEKIILQTASNDSILEIETYTFEFKGALIRYLEHVTDFHRSPTAQQLSAYWCSAITALGTQTSTKNSQTSRPGLQDVNAKIL